MHIYKFSCPYEFIISEHYSMKLGLKSINVKVLLLYLFLAVVNMSFFTMMVYENQIDLITENSKYHVKELTEDLVSSIKKLSADMGKGGILPLKDRDNAVREIAGLIKTKILNKDKTANFIIFNETGTLLYQSRPDFTLSKSDIKNGITAITNLDYSGRPFYSTVDEKSYTISFYIPHKLAFLGDSIMLLKIEVKELKNRLDELYILILVILCCIALFHVVFAVIFNRMFIRPIQSLHGKSLAISRGDLDARAEVQRSDEIGELGNAFNSMADSIREKINSLEFYNQMMEDELDMAGGVQKLIYPALDGDRRFNYAIYHKSLGKVSGDYYDIFNFSDSGIGCLLVDVSGHGVPAALVTMVVKEIFNRDARAHADPADLLRYMNTEILKLLIKDGMLAGIFCTAVYLVIDKNNVLHCCNAGHQQVLIVKPKKMKLSKISASGGPIGISEEMNDFYKSGATRVESGDKIIMFTDGIIEPMNHKGDQFGIEGLQASIRKSYMAPGKTIVQTIIDDLTAHIETEELKDDATIFLIEVK
ncbi:MAG: hypothetical protein A2W19_09025 [Spirochaetes bacterium RBG_16_49_21]|nr:MAG: hypothetical protein A2W19_09025 [Spirochaetes bacterium RBG_16_49_21]